MATILYYWNFEKKTISSIIKKFECSQISKFLCCKMKLEKIILADNFFYKTPGSRSS